MYNSSKHLNKRQFIMSPLMNVPNNSPIDYSFNYLRYKLSSSPVKEKIQEYINEKGVTPPPNTPVQYSPLNDEQYVLSSSPVKRKITSFLETHPEVKEDSHNEDVDTMQWDMEF